MITVLTHLGSFSDHHVRKAYHQRRSVSIILGSACSPQFMFFKAHERSVLVQSADASEHVIV